MTSLIEYFKTNNLKYYATSSTPASEKTSAYHAFNKSEKNFDTLTSPYYWQLSFSKPVLIISYTLTGGAGWSFYTKSWEVSCSLNNRNFTTIHRVTRDLKGIYEKLYVDTPSVCKHFKITGKTAQGDMRLAFYNFDCFGLLYDKRCTCNIGRIRHQLISNALMMIIQSCLAS